MKDTAKKLMLRIGILCAAVCLTGILALLHVADRARYPFTSSLVDSETVYIMLALCLLVLFALIGLTVSVLLAAVPVIRRNKGGHRRKRRKGAPPRFARLCEIDRAQKAQADYESRDLMRLCEDFRDFAAGELGLYYDIADIRRFVAGMSISRLMIIRGMSGTGKTSLAYAAGEFFGNPSTIVPVQPMWNERSDILGYFNEFTKRFHESALLCKLYEAGSREDIYITVLDEVNIARIEYYFAEFLSLLELPDPEKRELDVVSDSWENDPKRLHGGKLTLPENMWFIGTANNDESTFAISDKVYDRAAVLDLEKKYVPFPAKGAKAAHISWRELEGQFAKARQRCGMTESGREKLAQLDDYLARTLRIGFGNRILRQVKDYVPVMVACGGTEQGALDDILARKILRKLEQQSPALLKSEIPALQGELERLFGSGQMPLSREYLDGLFGRI